MCSFHGSSAEIFKVSPFFIIFSVLGLILDSFWGHAVKEFAPGITKNSDYGFQKLPLKKANVFYAGYFLLVTRLFNCKNVPVLYAKCIYTYIILLFISISLFSHENKAIVKTIKSVFA